MKTIILLTAILLTGCASLPNVLRNDTHCFDTQKAISKDHAMVEIARLNAIQEIAKNAKDAETQRALSLQINSRQRQEVNCK